MNHRIFRNPLLLTTCALGAVFATPSASAFTYTDSDLILVLRQSQFSDVEFNLGPVSNYLGLASGSERTVSNWDLSLALSTFGDSLEGVSFSLLATTGAANEAPRVWLTDGDGGNSPLDITGSKFRNINSKVSFFGVQAQLASGAVSKQSYVVSPSELSSFTFIASSGGLQPVSTLGGTTPFPVEGVAPGSLRFFELKSSTATVKPAALQVGVFSLTSEGALKFAAGVPGTAPGQPTIVGVSSSASGYAVSFTTETGVSYRLLSSDSVVSSVVSWDRGENILIGDGSVHSLLDPTSEPHRFYAIEATR